MVKRLNNQLIGSYQVFVILLFCTCSQAQNYDAELITQKLSLEVNKGSLIKDFYYEIKINNRKGEIYTNISIPFSKLSKLSDIDAYIKDAGGMIVKKLKSEDIVEKSAISDFSFYEEDYVKEFTLKHSQYPYTLIYSYKIKESEFLELDYWSPVMSEEVPTMNGYLNLSIPLNYKIAYSAYLVDKPIIDTIENKVTFQWRASYTDLIQDEEYAPDISDLLPNVKIVPIDFYYEKEGSFSDWVSFGNWQNDLLEGLNEIPDNEKLKIRNLVKDIKDDKEKIRVLYHYMQDEVRYVNVSIGTGGMKPFSAEYVANNKFGDCKALTNYFKSVLEFINIQSYYTKVYAGDQIREIYKDFPSRQSNHIILFIPLKGKDIWLDCTSDGPFNYLGTFSQNREAFVISKDNSRFVRTPALKPADVLEIRKIEVNGGINNPHVKAINKYKGEFYEVFLQLAGNYNDSEKSRIIENYIIEDGFQLIDYDIFKANRDSSSIDFSYNATADNVYRQYGNNILVSNIAFSLPELEKPEIRELPVQINYPIHKKDTIIYKIPEDYKVNALNDSITINTKYGSYISHANMKDGDIIITKSLLINACKYPLSEYDEFYSFIEQIKGLENRTKFSFTKVSL